MSNGDPANSGLTGTREEMIGQYQAMIDWGRASAWPSGSTKPRSLGRRIMFTAWAARAAWRGEVDVH